LLGRCLQPRQHDDALNRPGPRLGTRVSRVSCPTRRPPAVGCWHFAAAHLCPKPLPPWCILLHTVHCGSIRLQQPFLPSLRSSLQPLGPAPAAASAPKCSTLMSCCVCGADDFAAGWQRWDDHPARRQWEPIKDLGSGALSQAGQRLAAMFSLALGLALCRQLAVDGVGHSVASLQPLLLRGSNAAHSLPLPCCMGDARPPHCCPHAISCPTLRC
jgi:hypothetical protein